MSAKKEGRKGKVGSNNAIHQMFNVCLEGKKKGEEEE